MRRTVNDVLINKYQCRQIPNLLDVIIKCTKCNLRSALFEVRVNQMYNRDVTTNMKRKKYIQYMDL